MRNKNFSAQKELLCLFRTFWQDKNTLNKNIGRIDYLYSKAEKIKILVKKSRISKILDFELESKSFFIAKIVGSYSRISRGYREHLTSWYFSGMAINDLFFAKIFLIVGLEICFLKSLWKIIDYEKNHDQETSENQRVSAIFKLFFEGS